MPERLPFSDGTSLLALAASLEQQTSFDFDLWLAGLTSVLGDFRVIVYLA
jgi:hypothetical protein